MTIDVADNIVDSKELNAIVEAEAKVPIKALPCHIPDHARLEKTVLTANYFWDTIKQIEKFEQYINNAHKINHMNAIVNH
eukprot:6518533-Ditylum_brightwellii.AAC.1